MTQATIGSALVERRRELALEKGQAADKIGMSRTTYSSYEQDAQRPSVDVFPALAEFLNVSMEELLTLYGATCVAAVRPTLERILFDKVGDVEDATNGGETSSEIEEVTPASPVEVKEIESHESLDASVEVPLEQGSAKSQRDLHGYESTGLSVPESAVAPEATPEPSETRTDEVWESDRSPQLEESPVVRTVVRSTGFEPSTSIFKRELADASEIDPEPKKKKKKKKKKKN
jgi:transcriptional regulator with XRE-family HTH domain